VWWYIYFRGKIKYYPPSVSILAPTTFYRAQHSAPVLRIIRRKKEANCKRKNNLLRFKISKRGEEKGEVARKTKSLS
jgi:hypothetical protein